MPMRGEPQYRVRLHAVSFPRSALLYKPSWRCGVPSIKNRPRVAIDLTLHEVREVHRFLISISAGAHTRSAICHVRQYDDRTKSNTGIR